MNSVHLGDLAFTHGTSMVVWSRLGTQSIELKFRLSNIDQMVIDALNAWMWEFSTIRESDMEIHLMRPTDFFLLILIPAEKH